MTPTKFESLIIDRYLNYEFIIELIRKHSFEEFFEKNLIFLNNAIASNELHKLPGLASGILTSVNEKIHSIAPNEKIVLEDLFSDIFSELIDQLRKLVNGNLIVDQISENLANACEAYGYNYNELSRLLRLNSIQLKRNRAKTPSGLPYYQWNGTTNEKLELIGDLKNKGIIKDVASFKKLFTKIEVPFSLNVDSAKVNHLLVLFELLKVNKLITPKVISGHFTALKEYATDNGEKVFKKSPNKLNEKLKRNKTIYANLYQELAKSIRLNCPDSIATTMRQWPSSLRMQMDGE